MERFKKGNRARRDRNSSVDCFGARVRVGSRGELSEFLSAPKNELTPTEQLEYKIALLERELLKKEGEIVRLKKSIELERGDAKRK